MKQKQENISMLQIPNSVVRNIDMEINALDFCLYAYLKHMSYLNGRDGALEFSHARLMMALNITDVRTLKKMMKNLNLFGFIVEDITSLPKKGSMKLTFTGAQCNSPFTQLPTNLIYQIPHIGHLGLRLLYFYESYINRSIQSENTAFCFASYKTISSSLRISEPTLSKYNDILAKSKFLRITQHELSTETVCKDEGLITFDKYYNHYVPVISSMI